MLAPEVSVVLGSFNRRAFLKAAIRSVRENGIEIPYKIIVVDGGSTDGSLRWLCRQKDIITIVQHNRGSFRGRPLRRRSWGYFMNLGFKCAQGKYIVMISDDCLLVPGAIMNGLSHFEKMVGDGRKVGAIAFYWRESGEEDEYRVGLTFGNKMFVNHGLYLRSAMEEVGWVEEDLYQFYHADGDLCLKLWDHGYEVVDCETAYVEHYDLTNLRRRRQNLALATADWEAYLKRWARVLSDSDAQNSGGWIRRPYVDRHNTVARFPTGALLRGRVIRAGRGAKGKLSRVRSLLLSRVSGR